MTDVRQCGQLISAAGPRGTRGAPQDGQWSDIVEWTRSEVIKPNGVNQLEVLARRSHFTFLINGQVVLEADSDLFSQGYIGLAVEGYEKGEKISFDFLDYTLRG